MTKVTRCVACIVLPLPWAEHAPPFGALSTQYYFNRETQETSWEEPPGWAEAQAKAKAGASGLAAALPAAGGGGGGGEAAAEEEEAFTGDVGNLSDWEQFSDDEGDPYWHNATLDASSWFPPPGWEAHLASRAARA